MEPGIQLKTSLRLSLSQLSGCQPEHGGKRARLASDKTSNGRKLGGVSLLVATHAAWRMPGRRFEG